jgi:hypothetical protein
MVCLLKVLRRNPIIGGVLTDLVMEKYYLKFVDNENFSVEGLLRDFPNTGSPSNNFVYSFSVESKYRVP